MKLMIVEDNPHMCRLLTQLVSDLADAIVECTDGEQAVAAYAVEQPWGPRCHTTAPNPAGVTETIRISSPARGDGAVAQGGAPAEPWVQFSRPSQFYRCSRSRHFTRSIEPLRTGCQRSPTLSSRLRTVRIVNSEGSRPSFTSLHFKGVETVAPGNGRTE